MINVCPSLVTIEILKYKYLTVQYCNEFKMCNIYRRWNIKLII